VIQFLENEGLPFTWGEVMRVVEEFSPGVGGAFDPFVGEAIAHEVVVEGIRRSVAAVGKFLDLLEVPLPLKEDLSYRIETQLSWNWSVALWCLRRKGKYQLEMAVEKPGSTVTPKQSFRLPNPKPLRDIGEVSLDIQPGRVVLRSPSYAPDLAVANGRAFFRVRLYEPKDLEELKKASRKAKALAPFLSLMGVEDLREAIEALRGLKEGEVRAEGPYVLAKGERLLALRRGAIFGDPDLDGALLLGRDVTLAFPGEVEVSFRPYWTSRRMNLCGLKIRWKDEVFQGEEGFWADPILRDPIAKAIQNGLREEFERLESRPSSSSLGKVSPRMLAFLRVFASCEDPFQALAEGGLHRHATAELFADL